MYMVVSYGFRELVGEGEIAKCFTAKSPPPPSLPGELLAKL